MNEPIRVFIVDDQPVVRSGLAAFLMAYDDLELVGQAGGGDEARTLCAQLQPDVVLMDLMMPGMDGVQAIGHIREVCPDTRFIALTSFPEEDLVEGALRAGAISYMLKNAQASELADAIRAAYEGRSTISPEAAQALVRVATQEPVPGHDLSDRELEVLALMAEGLSNPEIADRLVVSRSTIKFHVSSILSKLSASSRTEAVALAMQNGLLED
jgi:NarL family two-component system response regulator LiaR